MKARVEEYPIWIRTAEVVLCPPVLPDAERLMGPEHDWSKA